MKFIRTLACTAVLLAGAASAQAALINRGGGMIYDTTLNITWLADMNYAKTSGYAASGVAPDALFDTNAIWTDGHMGWDAANTWANSLVYGGFDDWRLASVNAGDTRCGNSINPGGGFPAQHFGFNCISGELGHLFVVDLGNGQMESVLDQVGDTPEQIANLALFTNVTSYGYWASLEYAPDTKNAWYFFSQAGYQLYDLKTYPLYAAAVRPGDVVATVPEPQTLALVLMAFGAAMLTRKRHPL